MARTVAMSANRILDRNFDALNPRTAKRELGTGELSRGVQRPPADAEGRPPRKVTAPQLTLLAYWLYGP